MSSEADGDAKGGAASESKRDAKVETIRVKRTEDGKIGRAHV